jgi:hypothetical protein
MDPGQSAQIVPAQPALSLDQPEETQLPCSLRYLD